MEYEWSISRKHSSYLYCTKTIYFASRLQTTKWYRCFEKQKIKLDPSNWGRGKLTTMQLDAVVKSLEEVNVNVFNKNWNALSCVPEVVNALTNSKSAAMQIRKTEINDHVNLITNFYFLFCFLTVNKIFMDRSVEHFWMWNFQS